MGNLFRRFWMPAILCDKLPGADCPPVRLRLLGENPNVPEGDTYKHKVRIKSYAVIEKAGLIWVYMGPEDQQPPFYQFEWLDTPDSHRFMQKLMIKLIAAGKMPLESRVYFLVGWAAPQSVPATSRFDGTPCESVPAR